MVNGMAKGEDIERRLIAYAVRVVHVCGALPRSPVSRHLIDQLVRSGTAPAALYAEARTAESRRDFIHKMRIALKEMNESRIWLTIIVQSELLAESRLTDLLSECDQMCRILNSSIHTAQSNAPDH